MLEKEILYLFIAVIIILVILFVILIYLIVRKALENWHIRKIESYKEQYNEPLLSYLMDNNNSLTIVVDRFDKKMAIEELLSHYSEVLEGENEKNNLYSIAELYLVDYYMHGLRSRKWSTRMNTLYHIEDFQIRSLKAEVKKLINRKKVSKAERVLGLRILSLFQHSGLFEELSTNHHTLSEFDFRGILMKANHDMIHRLVEGFDHCSPTLQYAILEVIALKHVLNYVTFIESVYLDNSGELKLRALKALASIGYVNNIEEFLSLCKSEHWQERMMIAKLLGKFRDEEGIKCLEGLLQDSSWWVRSQAGQSIKNYPNGNLVLKKIYETSTDPFAKDMALEWMNRGD